METKIEALNINLTKLKVGNRGDFSELVVHVYSGSHSVSMLFEEESPAQPSMISYVAET